MLQNPPAGDWLTWRRWFDYQGFSPLKQITKSNVNNLRVAWTWTLPPGARRGAVLWDLDGTLVDSEEYHWLAWKEILNQEGISLTREQFLSSFGQRNDAILGAWLGQDVSL